MADYETMTAEEFKEMKEKEKEEVFEMLSESTQKLMEEGELIKYLDLQAKLFRETTSNVLLIKEQRPDAVWVRPAEEWKKYGAFIKKGETGISVIRMKNYQKIDGSIGTSFEIGKVFDVKQTSAADRPIAMRDYGDLTSSIGYRPPCMIEKVAEVSGTGDAFYDRDQEVIFVKEDLGRDEYFIAMARELSCCELMSKDYSKEREDVLPFAECSAYLLAKRFGVDAPAPDVSKLIGRFTGKEEKEVRKELSDTKQAAAIISSRILDHQKKLREEREAER